MILKLLPFIILTLISSGLTAQYPDENDEDYDSSYDENLPFVEIKALDSFEAITKNARDNNKIILLEMSASYCGYCKTLEEEIIKPMLRSGDYDHVLIRKLNIDSHYPMNDLQGNKSSAFKLSSKMGVYLTPTLLFLDGHGNEVSKRITGINTLELYGGYVDDALRQGIEKIQHN